VRHTQGTGQGAKLGIRSAQRKLAREENRTSKGTEVLWWSAVLEQGGVVRGAGCWLVGGDRERGVVVCEGGAVVPPPF
jgi:hypothetical protein